MIKNIINNRAMFLVHGIGRMNLVTVLSRGKTDVSRGGGVNDGGKKMADRYLGKMTLKVGHGGKVNSSVGLMTSVSTC